MSQKSRASSPRGRVLGFGIAAAVAIPLLTPVAAAAEVTAGFTFQLLNPAAAGTTSLALGLNDHGTVVGTARTAATSRPQLAVQWTAGQSAATVLGAIEGSTFSRAFDINNSGVAAGEGFTPAPEVSKPLLFSGGTTGLLPSLNPNGTGVANDLNDLGTVTGSSNSTSAGAGRAFTTTASATTELPLPAGDPITSTAGRSINNSGAVAGIAYVSRPHGDHSHAVAVPVVWDSHGATLLETPAGLYSSSSAYGISDTGLVVGSQGSAPEQAVSWSGNTGTVLPAFPATGITTHSRALAANSDGDIVGYASQYAGNYGFGGKALLWQDGQVLDLNELTTDLPAGYTLQAANDINENGQIVGAVSTPEGSRGFLLTPVPETAPVSVAVSGLSGHYHAGGVLALTAVVDPAPEHAHFHWFTKDPGSSDWVEVDGAAGTLGAIVRTADNGREYKVQVVGEGEVVLAESAPVTVVVDDHGSSPVEGAVISATLPENAGSLVVSVAPENSSVDLGEFVLNPAADRYVATGELGAVTVTDTRTEDAGWTASGRVRGFVTADGERLAGGNLGWTPKVVSVSDGQVVAAGAAKPSVLSGGAGVAAWSPLGSAAAGDGRGTAQLGADLVVEAPTTIVPGTYQGLMILTVV